MKSQAIIIVLCIFAVQGSFQNADIEPNFMPDDIIKVFRGVFEAWKANNESVNLLLGCTDSMTDVEAQIISIINETQQFDPSDPRRIVESVIRIIINVENIIKDTLICIDSAEDFKVMLNRIIVLTPTEILLRVYFNFMYNAKRVSDDIATLINAYNAGDFYNIGYKAGDIADVILFKQASNIIKELIMIQQQARQYDPQQGNKEDVEYVSVILNN